MPPFPVIASANSDLRSAAGLYCTGGTHWRFALAGIIGVSNLTHLRARLG
jgi:hypothetical protein